MKTQKRQWKPKPGSLIRFKEGHLAIGHGVWWIVLDNRPCTKILQSSSIFCKNCSKILGQSIVIKEGTGNFFSTDEQLLSVSIRCVGCWMLYQKVTYAEKGQNGAT